MDVGDEQTDAGQVVGAGVENTLGLNINQETSSHITLQKRLCAAFADAAVSQSVETDVIHSS